MSEPCKHDHLYFGSGGYYIFCRRCQATWKPDDEEKARLKCCTGVVTDSIKEARVKLPNPEEEGPKA